MKYNRLHATSVRVNMTLEQTACGSCCGYSTYSNIPRRRRPDWYNTDNAWLRRP